MINIGELLSRVKAGAVRFLLDDAIKAHTDPLEDLIRGITTALDDEQDRHFTSNRDLINDKFTEADARMDARESDVDNALRLNGERIAELEGTVKEQASTINALLKSQLNTGGKS